MTETDRKQTTLGKVLGIIVLSLKLTDIKRFSSLLREKRDESKYFSCVFHSATRRKFVRIEIVLERLTCRSYFLRRATKERASDLGPSENQAI